MKFSVLALLFSILLCGCGKDPAPVKEPQATVTIKSNNRKNYKSPDISQTSATLAQNANEKFPVAEYAEGIAAGKDILLEGRVTNHKNGPVAEALVSLYSDPLEKRTNSPSPYATVKTAKNGRYRLGVAKGFSYKAVIAKAGYADENKTFSTSDAMADSRTNPFSEVLKQNFTLTPAYVLNGIITDNKNQPITNARVWLFSEYSAARTNDIAATSAADGTFIIPKFPREDVGINVFAEGFAPVSLLSVKKSENTTEPLKIVMEPGGGAITGRVTIQSGSPVSSGTVIQIRPSPKRNASKPFEYNHSALKTVTDESGRYRLAGLPAESYIVQLAHDNNNYRNLPTRCAAEIQFVTVAPHGESTFDLTAYTGHTVEGYVYDKESSTPLSGVKVTTFPYITDTTTDNNGYYKLNNIFESVSITPISDDFIPAQAIPYAMVQSCDNLLTRHDIPMIEPVTISGTVKNADALPVADARIFVLSETFQKENIGVNSAGEFSVKVPPLISLNMIASAPQYANTINSEIEIGIKDITDISIILHKGFSVVGTITDTTGSLVPEAKIRSNGSLTNLRNNLIPVDPSGKFSLPNIGKNTQLHITAENYISQYIDFRQDITEDGGTTEVLIKLAPAASIEGTVKLTNGESYKFDSHRYILVSDPNKRMQYFSLNNDGTFKLTNLTLETTYSLNIQGNAITTPVLVLSGSKNVELIFEDKNKTASVTTGTITVTVLDQKSKTPIGNAEVILGDKKAKPIPNIAGQYFFENVALNPGEQVKVSAKDYFDAVKNIVPNVDIQNITVELGSGGSIVGKLIFEDTGAPAADVLVRRVENRNKTAEYTVSDKEGKFILPKLSPGAAILSIKPDAPYIEVRQNYTVPNEEVVDTGEIRLSKGGAIYGKVLNVAGAPYQDKNVRLMGSSDNYNISKDTKTNSSGEFDFKELPPLQYRIVIDTPSIMETVEVARNEVKTVIIQEGGTKFIGSVLSGDKPVGQFVVATGGHSHRDYHAQISNGKFELTGLQPGRYSFRIMQTDIRSAHTEEVIVPDDEVFSHTFNLPSGIISGIVTDTEDKPLAGAKVSINSNRKSTGGYDQAVYRGSPTTTTDAEGRYKFEALADGSYDILATSDEGSAAKKGVIVGRNETKINLKLDSAGGTLESVCINAETGQPIVEAWCYITSENGTRFNHDSVRDNSGVVKVQNIPPGTYTVSVSYWSHTSVDKTIEIKSGETTRIEDALFPAGAIRWTLKNADGGPAGTVNVTIEPQNGNPIETIRNVTSGPDGLCVERGLTAGAYLLTATKDGKSVSETFTVTAKDIAAKETQVSEWK